MASLRTRCAPADGSSVCVSLASDELDTLKVALRVPTAERVFQIKRAMHAGVSVKEIAELTHIDPWFLAQIKQ